MKPTSAATGPPSDPRSTVHDDHQWPRSNHTENPGRARAPTNVLPDAKEAREWQTFTLRRGPRVGLRGAGSTIKSSKTMPTTCSQPSERSEKRSIGRKLARLIHANGPPLRKRGDAWGLRVGSVAIFATALGPQKALHTFSFRAHHDTSHE